MWASQPASPSVCWHRHRRAEPAACGQRLTSPRLYAQSAIRSRSRNRSVECGHWTQTKLTYFHAVAICALVSFFDSPDLVRLKALISPPLAKTNDSRRVRIDDKNASPRLASPRPPCDYYSYDLRVESKCEGNGASVRHVLGAEGWAGVRGSSIGAVVWGGQKGKKKREDDDDDDDDDRVSRGAVEEQKRTAKERVSSSRMPSQQWTWTRTWTRAPSKERESERTRRKREPVYQNDDDDDDNNNNNIQSKLEGPNPKLSACVLPCVASPFRPSATAQMQILVETAMLRSLGSRPSPVQFSPVQPNARCIRLLANTRREVEAEDEPEYTNHASTRVFVTDNSELGITAERNGRPDYRRLKWALLGVGSGAWEGPFESVASKAARVYTWSVKKVPEQSVKPAMWRQRSIVNGWGVTYHCGPRHTANGHDAGPARPRHAYDEPARNFIRLKRTLARGNRVGSRHS
ncbi:hypothetical protein V9T40_000186 [Parthenolecanium corni]|uniref:Uncharacterized protein n=1 Tax=Parthenolecanium corni TaxID=536013 RepID=A0AAN9T925_9HEMI